MMTVVQLAKDLHERGWHVIATCRKVTDDLEALGSSRNFTVIAGVPSKHNSHLAHIQPPRLSTSAACLCTVVPVCAMFARVSAHAWSPRMITRSDTCAHICRF
jgi:hypothetical protein